MIIFGIVFSERALAVVILALLLIFLGLNFWRNSRRRNKNLREIRQQWKNLLGLCKDPLNWPHVVIMADNLLLSALKAKKVKGKTTGEKLVKVQRILSDNDGIWSAHKLSRKLEQNPKTELDKEQLKELLMSFKQTLKDLGVL